MPNGETDSILEELFEKHTGPCLVKLIEFVTLYRLQKEYLSNDTATSDSGKIDVSYRSCNFFQGVSSK